MTEELNCLDLHKIPAHIAIIMDGNGRWAKLRGKPRSEGHRMGVETVKCITEESVRLGVRFLTLYTFSTENWNRPSDEVATLMALILDALEEELFIKNNVRFRVIGDIRRLPLPVQEKLEQCMKHTEDFTAMTLTVALSYSSYWEITQATRKIAEQVKAGHLQPGDITESCISHFLETNYMPNPDLLIRTGGELRLSNYLLWQCAYTELYFCDTYWPDFNENELHKAIAEYQRRERRFGKTSEQIHTDEGKTKQ